MGRSSWPHISETDPFSDARIMPHLLNRILGTKAFLAVGNESRVGTEHQPNEF